MNNISIFLEKYGNIGLKESQIKNALIKSVLNSCKFSLDEKEIKVSKNQIKINVSGSKKSEIYLSQKEIEEDFYSELKKVNLVIKRNIL